MANSLIMKENLSVLREKLSTIEFLLKTQAEEIQIFRRLNPSANHEDLLMAQQKSTRTSLELLRDEIDELIDIVVLTSAKIKTMETE